MEFATCDGAEARYDDDGDDGVCGGESGGVGGGVGGGGGGSSDCTFSSTIRSSVSMHSAMNLEALYRAEKYAIGATTSTLRKPRPAP